MHEKYSWPPEGNEAAGGLSPPTHPTGPEEKEGLYFSELWERAQEQSEQVKNTGELTWLTIH